MKYIVLSILNDKIVLDNPKDVISFLKTLYVKGKEMEITSILNKEKLEFLHKPSENLKIYKEINKII